MEIVIGATPYVGLPEKKRRIKKETLVEAHLLAMRQSRKPYGIPPPGKENKRFRAGGLDPAGSRILTILVPDGNDLPQDLTAGGYKILMRFVQRR